MLTPMRPAPSGRPASPVPDRDTLTSHVRDTCERLVTALSCLDSPRLAVAVARPILVRMHDRIEAERRWLHVANAAGGHPPLPALDDYDACLLRLDAVVLDVVAGEEWVCCPFRREAVDRLRAATIDLVRASQSAP